MNKSERVYHFRTEKDHRRLCHSSFSYLRYWMDRHDAESDRVRKEINKEVKELSDLFSCEEKGTAPFFLLVLGIVGLLLTIACIVAGIS